MGFFVLRHSATKVNLDTNLPVFKERCELENYHEQVEQISIWKSTGRFFTRFKRIDGLVLKQNVEGDEASEN